MLMDDWETSMLRKYLSEPKSLIWFGLKLTVGRRRDGGFPNTYWH